MRQALIRAAKRGAGDQRPVQAAQGRAAAARRAGAHREGAVVSAAVVAA